MAIADGHGFPLSVYVASASPHETKLVEPTLDQRFLVEAPKRMIGDSRKHSGYLLDKRLGNIAAVAYIRGFLQNNPPASFPLLLERVVYSALTLAIGLRLVTRRNW